MTWTSLETSTRPRSELDIPPDRLPRHIAIIMDGNGRWARRRGLPRIAGHRQGAKVVDRVVEECAQLGIGQLTLYCLSVENWKRPKQEIDQLMDLLQQYLIDERPKIKRNNIRFRVIGRRTGLPDDVLREMDETIAGSNSHTGMTLCLAINYGGRQEIADAVRQLALQVKAGTLDPDAIDETMIADALYTQGMPEPDLLIRTAGEQRISNFLLWQISYAEIWVTDACWPDFSTQRLHEALRSFAQRERRYGGLGG